MPEYLVNPGNPLHLIQEKYQYSALCEATGANMKPPTLAVVQGPVSGRDYPANANLIPEICHIEWLSMFPGKPGGVPMFQGYAGQIITAITEYSPVS